MLNTEKDFSTLALPITEQQYRNDGAMHYSTLASFERGGFHSIPTLGEKKESPALSFGSVVDCMMTDGMEAFKEHYYVAPIMDIPDNLKAACRILYTLYKDEYRSLMVIPEEYRIAALDSIEYGKTWRTSTRLEKLAMASGYYLQLVEAGSKEILLQSDYNKALKVCDALKTSPATAEYFKENMPFDNCTRYFQLKFSGYVTNKVGKYDILPVKSGQDYSDVAGNPDWIRYSCMADEIVVDYKNKIIYPIDLKTTSSYEDEFYKSFIKWNYQIQARLYWRLINAAVKADDYFRDFRVADYTFIVANKDNPQPLTWTYEDTKYSGTLRYGKDGNIFCKDPFSLGEELDNYLKLGSTVQRGVSTEEKNSLTKFLDLL